MGTASKELQQQKSRRRSSGNASIDFTKDPVGDRRTLSAVSELVRLCFAVRSSLNEKCQWSRDCLRGISHRKMDVTIKYKFT